MTYTVSSGVLNSTPTPTPSQSLYQSLHWSVHMGDVVSDICANCSKSEELKGRFQPNATHATQGTCRKTHQHQSRLRYSPRQSPGMHLQCIEAKGSKDWLRLGRVRCVDLHVDASALFGTVNATKRGCGRDPLLMPLVTVPNVMIHQSGSVSVPIVTLVSPRGRCCEHYKCQLQQ